MNRQSTGIVGRTAPTSDRTTPNGKSEFSGRWAGALICWFVVTAALAIVPIHPIGAAVGDAPVTGAIHLDFDRDGLNDPGEAVSDTAPLFPPAGVTVIAYDATGASVPCVVTAGTPPTYSCPVAGLAGSAFRVEFELDLADSAAGWTPAPSGSDYGTSVQFVGPGDVANWAVVPPSECPSSGTGFDGNANTADGKVWTTCFVNGDKDAGGPQDVVVGVNYDTSGAIEKVGLKGDGDDATEGSAELGSVWGIAFDEWNSTLFTSAVLKRHHQFGSEGIDGLYWMDYPSGTWNSISLDTLGGPGFGAPLTRDLEGKSFDDLSYDLEAAALVGKTGIGDINVTPDGQTLLVSNLDKRTVEVYDITATATGGNPVWLRSIPIGNPGCSDAANPDDYTIWALHTQNSQDAFVGVTCTAQNSAAGGADLEAHLVPIDIVAGNAGASVFTIPLDYTRSCAGGFPACGSGPLPDGSYTPWIDGWTAGMQHYHQPIFSDIEFTADGSMVIGILDRMGLQLGARNYRPIAGSTALVPAIFTSGDLLHACNTTGDPNNPTWLLEGAAGSACDPFNNFPDATGGDLDNQANHFGPGGLAEWYGLDRFLGGGGSGPGGHAETSHGGLYVNTYKNEAVVSIMDPSGFNTGGLSWFSAADGSNPTDVTLYEGSLDSGFAGKGLGIGDVEGCFLPIEIGNFVWLDLDGDGIQDPDELPLAGVTVTLYDAAGNVVATTVTDANGEYYFDSADGVDANTAYTIGFDVSTNTTPLPGGATNADLAETLANATGDGSDSDIVGGEIEIMTGDPGVNDHTFDAGFTLPFDLSLQKQLADGSNLGLVQIGDTVTFTITLTNQGLQPGTDITVTDYLPATGLTLADPAWTDNGDGTADIVVPGPLAPGAMTTVDISFTVDAGATGQVNNWAEISSADNDSNPDNGFPTDVDSTPNDDPDDDNQPSGPNDATDDDIGGDGLNGGDEDDHDIASVTIGTPPAFDLALQKQLADGTNLGAVLPGDTVTFTITVFNQGAVDGENITVTDYLPATGLTLADPAWTDNGDGTAQITVPGPLAPGASTTVDITFTVDADATGQINNLAEISAADPTDGAGNIITDGFGNPITDADSTPDDDPAGDNQPSGPNATGDDDISGDGLNGGDEDDHDIAGITIGTPPEPVFDLALLKQLADGTNLGTVAVGDEVTFTLSIINQGTVNGADLTIVDYLPEGLTLADPDWTNNNDGTTTIAIPGPITPGTTVTVDITFTVNADATGTISNWAEIGSATAVDANGNAITGPNGEPLPDIDSIPDADNADGFETDDNTNGNGRDGGDEDDHDIAQLTIQQPELAFTGTTTTITLIAAISLLITGLGTTHLAGTTRRRKQEKTTA